MKADVKRVTKNVSPSHHDKYDIVLYTDGASKGNPGPGGFGCTIRVKGVEVSSVSGGSEMTTNNIMELTAAIRGLQKLNRIRHCTDRVLVLVDSQYVLKGVTEWVEGWSRRSWVKGDKKPVANKELWIELLDLLETINYVDSITWGWVRGHDGVEGNERADELANEGCAPYLS